MNNTAIDYTARIAAAHRADVLAHHILAKLGAANRTEAATIARRQGLLRD